MKCAITLVAGFITTSWAWADQVILTNGRTLEGIARQEPGRVVVETRWGTIGLPASEVQSILPGRTPLHEYEERLAALGPRPEASQVFELAVWAQERGLVRYVNSLLEKTVAINPDHAEARRLLGRASKEGSRATRRGDELESRSTRPEPRKPRTLRPHPLPEMDPGYVYLGIPPLPPPRGSQRHDYGYGTAVWEGLILAFGRPSMSLR